MKYSNTVEYNINTKLDSSGLTKLQAQIKQLENSMQQMSNRELLNSDKVQAAKTQLEGLNTALTNSFNSSLGILDLSKFRAELDSSGVSATGLQSAFNMMGAEGQAALNGLTSQIANFNGGMERTSSQIDKIFTTFSNTFRWGLVSSFFSQFMNAIHSSVDYVKELDDSLTQIMLVTDYNRDSMNEFAKSANEAAKAVSMTTTGMTNASLIFAQQGYDLEQSQELATLSAKLANASQQDTATTSDQITAYMNAYGLENSISDLTQAMDNWALIANISAADVGELAQASQRAASMANTVGVSGEQLAAQIATIESVTREAPEQIGNGLKTLYARFSDISAGGEDEDGVSLGDVTKQLNDIGVQVLDQFGNIRDVGDIMEDLMVVWDDLDETSKIAAAQSLAGKYQVNRFVSLMDNSDMYKEYLGATGSSAAGTLDQMNEEYAQSIEGRTAKLQASLEGLFSTIFNTDDIYPWMDAAQGAVDLLQQFFDALGGGKTVLLGITSLLTQAFSQNIARSINDTLANRELMQTRQRNIEGVNDTLDRVGIDRNSGIGQYISTTAEQASKGAINDAQYDAYMANVQNWINAQTALTQSEEELQDTINALNMAYGKAVGENNAVFKDENGLNTQFANDERLNLNQDQINKIMSQADFSEAIAGARNFSNELQQVQSIQEKYNSSAENAKQQLEQLYVASDRADTALEQLYNTGVIGDDMFNDMKTAIAKVVVDLEESGQATDQTEQELNELIATMGRFVKMAENMDANQLKKTLLNGAEEVQKKQTTRDFNQTQVDRADENAQESQQNISNQQNIKEILDTFNAVQQLTFAWQAFQNLGSLWANEDLSTGEKVLQTIMNLTMAMPQLITAMQTLQGNSFLQNVGNGLMNVLGNQANIGTLETLGQSVMSGKNAAQELENLRGIITVGDEAKSILGEVAEAGGEYAPQLLEMAKNGDEARKKLTEVGSALTENVESGQAANAALGSLSGVMGKAMASAAAEGATGLGILGAGLKAVAAEAWTAIAPFAPFIAILGVAAIALGVAQKQAKEAHDQAIADFEEVKNAQQQVTDLSTKMDDWKSKRQSGGDNKELAKDADALADSLRELGNEEEAEKVHLAAIRAEANGTADSFNKLEDTLNAANQSMSDQSALATMEAANAVLKDRLSTTEEIAAANEAMQSAALDYNINQMSRTAGMDMGIVNAPGDMDLRAATMDWQTLEHMLDQSVPGFAEITDENEKLALALSHTSDEALRAAIQIEQLANANTNLTEGQQTGIVQRLENSGFSAQESLQFMASLDEEASYREIVEKLEEVKQQVDAGTPFEVALQAKMDPEQIRESVEASLAAYEPKDEDVDAADFQSLSSTFMDNADNMGEEGTPFADYSEDLLKNADALEEVVEGILRYDDAIETLDKNLEDWRDALNNTNEFSKEHIDAVQDLQETYADFLDLSEDMDVSEEFAANADNLELMEDAANGVEGAYEELAQAAAEDILIHADVDDVDKAKEALNGLFDYLNSDAFSNLNIGDALDLSGIEGQINDLADATGWTADQMAAYLNSIGINIDPNMFAPVETGLDNVTADAATMASNVQGIVSDVASAIVGGLSYSTDTEMTAQTDTQQDQIMYTDLTPTPGPETTITSTFPVGSANPTAGGSGGFEVQTAEAVVRGVTYEPHPVTERQMKEMTGYGITSTVKQGPGSTGGVHLKKGATASKGSRGTAGAGKSSGGSRPSSSGGGGGGKKSCFVAGTLVSIWGGFKPIEQIKKGNIVLSYNKQLGINEYSEVIQTMIHDTTEPIYTLYIKDEQLRVTGIHRFLVTDKITCGICQWVHAADLHVGQWVLFADGTWHVIHKIEVNIEHQIVYNFEVSGNHNYYVGRNQILAHNKGGGKKGKKGGGGGGKAKTAEKKEEEKYQKKYYEEVDHQLDKVDKTLDNVEKTTDKLIGTKARTKQNEQIKLLQREILLQEKKLKILRDQEKTDVSKAISEADKKLEDLLKKEGLDIKIFDIAFDKDGFIRNTDEIGQAIIDAENELIKERNNLISSDGTISDANEEKLKEIDKQIEKYKKLGDELTKNMDRYNDIVNEELEIENTIEEIKDQIQDINIDVYKTSQEALDDLKDLREEWAKFSAGIYDADAGESFLYLDNPIRQLKEIENEITSIYTVSGQEARNYYNEIIKQQEKLRDSATTEEDIKAYQQAIDYFAKIRDSIEEDTILNNGLMQLALNDVVELQKIWNEWDETSRDNPIFGDNKSALKEALEDAQKRLMEYAQDYEELIEDLKEATLDIADHTSEQWDRQLDRFDRVLDQLDRYSDTYSLIYGDDAYDMQEAVLNQQAQTLKSQLDTAKQAYDDAYKYYLEAYEKFVDKETGLAKEGYEDYMYELEEAVADAEENMRDIAADAAEKFAEAFEAAVKASTQYILRNTIGENDFDHLDRNWEWDKEYIDKYRDNVEKAYEMDKLRNKYLDMLNDAQGASLQTQNKIRAQMQEQLDLLDGQATVSEYDVKLANAKLEILQKQIALEDAQRNKNRMQLRRDTQGNYRYVYRADQGDVKQAQQELADSEYDAYEMSKQQQMNNYDDMINAYKRYLSQREEILTNNNLSEAQKIQQIQELWDRFQKYVNAAQEDFSNATSGTVDILQWLVINGTDYTTTAATDMLNTLLDEEGNVIEQSGIMWMDMANNMTNNVIPNIENAVMIADENIERKLHETHDNLVGEDGSGGIFGEVAAGASDFGDQCEKAAQQTAILAEQSWQLQDALNADDVAFTDAIANLQDYQMQLEQVSEASSNTAATLRDTQRALDNANAENLNYKTQIDRLRSGEDIIVNHEIVNAAEYKKKQEEEKKKQQQKSSGGGGGGRNALADARAIWYKGAWGHGGDWYTPYSKKYGKAAANKVLRYFNQGYGYNFDFDTGGYTGEWNQGEGASNHKNGKLAFLHQKELVLNQTDTANILAAVNTMREISNSMQGSLSGIGQMANINNISSTYNPVTKQRVEIQASFPNATDAEDIRQALINLSDKAYQYSYRTR